MSIEINCRNYVQASNFTKITSRIFGHNFPIYLPSFGQPYLKTYLRGHSNKISVIPWVNSIGASLLFRRQLRGMNSAANLLGSQKVCSVFSSEDFYSILEDTSDPLWLCISFKLYMHEIRVYSYYCKTEFLICFFFL